MTTFEPADDMPYCPAAPGMGPHNFQPVLDIVSGSGIWLYCNQCGEHVKIEGTAIVPPGAASPAVQPGGNAAVPAPSGRTGFP